MKLHNVFFYMLKGINDRMLAVGSKQMAVRKQLGGGGGKQFPRKKLRAIFQICAIMLTRVNPCGQ